MEELGIEKHGGSVCFGQLMGMCDHVSLTLGELQLELESVYKICSVKLGEIITQSCDKGIHSIPFHSLSQNSFWSLK